MTPYLVPLSLSSTNNLVSLEAFREWRHVQRARLHVVVAGGDPTQGSKNIDQRVLRRILETGAATRVLTEHHQTLIDLSPWPFIQAWIKYAIKQLAVNLAHLERDLMHDVSTQPRTWRRDHEHDLVVLLSERPDLTAALYWYRQTPSLLKKYFRNENIWPALRKKRD